MDAITSASSVSLHPALTQLSDEDLLTGTRRLVGASNQLLASLLVHLGEVETRGLHRTRACSSLYTYCIYELRFSEDAAFRRVSAARLVKRFPILFDTIASGELHLTAILMLGPHLTTENVVDVLARAKHRTKREIAQLVRQLDPLPDIPARIEPLGPTPVRQPVSLRNPSWGAFVSALNPVRNLNPGERPRDWMDEDFAGLVNGKPTDEAGAIQPAPARSEASEATEGMPGSGTTPQRYSVQFTTTSEHVDLVERAKALLSSSHQGASLAEVHLRALREFVASLEKRKYGAPARRRKQTSGVDEDGRGIGGHSAAERDFHSRQVSAEAPGVVKEPPKTDCGSHAAAKSPRQRGSRGRHIPSAIRREVFERDSARCTFVDSSGQRCRETHALELHHLLAFAYDGPHQASNLTLRCRAHNALAAEQDFGREHMEHMRTSTHHDSFARESMASVTAAPPDRPSG